MRPRTPVWVQVCRLERTGRTRKLCDTSHPDEPTNDDDDEDQGNWVVPVVETKPDTDGRRWREEGKREGEGGEGVWSLVTEP